MWIYLVFAGVGVVQYKGALTTERWSWSKNKIWERKIEIMLTELTEKPSEQTVYEHNIIIEQ